jgi:hypothetical protein
MIKKLYKIIKENPIYLYLLFYFFLLITLSFFRDASADEAYYLKETALMAELLKEGTWVGDYGVGLHGFLFKLPVAILFIILGKSSVFLATLFTILLSITSLVLFYKIVVEKFLNKKFAFWSVVLLSVALHFIGTSISFNRDIAALFTVLLFLYVFLNKKNNGLLIGIIFLLMLDAKEHVFLTVAPLYMLYLLIEWIRRINRKEFWKLSKDFLYKNLIAYIPAFTWVVLMFTTSAIPINMFIPSILDFVEIGQGWNMGHFSVEIGSGNTMGKGEKEITKLSEIENTFPKSEILNIDKVRDVFTKVLEITDILIAYVGKILYPRTFSFISVPKIIALPGIIYSLTLFKEWFKKKDKKYILSLVLWFNILAVILRASHGRYLLAVVPVFMLFFVMFLRSGLQKPRYFIKVAIATTAFVILGLFFETTFLEFKIVLEVSLLILFWMIWLLKNSSKKVISFSKDILLFALSSAMFLTTVMFSYKIGQISNYQKYGYNRENENIALQFSKERKIWISDYESKDIIDFYRGNLYIEPEWNWKLASWLPKKYLLKTYGEEMTFVSSITNMEIFKEYIYENKIEEVVFFKSTIIGEEFPYEEREDELFSQEWLTFEKEIEFKNKIIYVFKVEN